MEKEQVERYKLTPEQAKFQKNFAKVKKVEQFLKAKLFETMAGAKSLSDLLRETQMGMSKAIRNLPARKINEIEGQE